MDIAVFTIDSDGPSSEQIMPTDIPLVESDDSEIFEVTTYYGRAQLSKDEERICDMATD